MASKKSDEAVDSTGETHRISEMLRRKIKLYA